MERRELTVDEYDALCIPGGGLDLYMPLYKAVVNFLPAPNECHTIIDLGSGLGHFAKILFSKGYVKYIGIDFAPARVEKSRELLPEASFILGDLRSQVTREFIQDFDTFVILETLEHIKDDLGIVRSIPSGSLVILSVPNTVNPNHVRRFKTSHRVVKRYEKYLGFVESETVTIGRRRGTKFAQGSKIFVFKTRRL